jgi:uncharacterized damage-inducible protein DinB
VIDTATQMMLDIQRHNAFSTGRLLDAASNLSPDQLRTPLGEGSFGDLLATLIHMYDAQRIWLDRCRTGKNGPAHDVSDFPDIPTLRAAWDQLDSETEAYIASLDDATLHERVRYRTFSGHEGVFSRRDMLLQQALHGAQHRGEVALVVSGLGHSPGELDFAKFIHRQNGQ